MEYKKQHWVTESYLKAWCDPETPKGYEPYVWLVSKKDKTVDNKSPKKIFNETDFYTIIDSEGNRNVEFEKSLQKIETKFISIQRNKINAQLRLDDNEMFAVSTFIATMFARVKHQRDLQKEMWQEWLDEIDNAPKEILKEIKQTETYKQVKNIESQPLPYNVINFANLAVPFFSRMGLEILETTTKPGFIVSDNPCFIFDPKVYTVNPPLSWVELFSSPTVEILFPISPQQLISLKPNGPDRYLSIDKVPAAIDEINKLITANSEEFIVLNQKQYNNYWFD